MHQGLRRNQIQVDQPTIAGTSRLLQTHPFIFDQVLVVKSHIKSLSNSDAYPGNEEGPDHAPDDDEVLDAPEAVLDPSPGVGGRLDVDHDDGHEGEEQSHYQIQPGHKKIIFSSVRYSFYFKKPQSLPVDRQVADGLVTVKLPGGGGGHVD